MTLINLDYLEDSSIYLSREMMRLVNDYNEGAIDQTLYSGKEISEFYEYCEGYFRANGVCSDQSRMSYALETLKIYQMMPERYKEIWYDLVVDKGYNICYALSSINYRITMDTIFEDKYTFITFDAYVMMFDLIKAKIERNDDGYKTKKVKNFVLEYTLLIPDRYFNSFKNHVVSTMGTEGKKLMMTLALERK